MTARLQAAIGVPLVIVGANKAQPDEAKGPRATLTVGPGFTGLSGTF